ncbi:hypothetical protein [Listeria sp. ILCC797]|nr:hypothetical protein [Listeria sp. ILCC797]
MNKIIDKYYLFIFANLFGKIIMIYPAAFGIMSIFLFIMVLVPTMQIKVVHKVNNPQLLVYTPQTKLMYIVLAVLFLCVVGATIFLGPFINQTLEDGRGYLGFVYDNRFVLYIIGMLLLILANLATVGKIQKINDNYMKRIRKSNN